MPRIKLESSKTYATEATAITAVEKRKLGELRYFIMRTENGRFFPVFLQNQGRGRPTATEIGVHTFFHVIG